MGKLNSYDEAVAMQVAAILWKNGEDLRSEKLKTILRDSKVHVKHGFAAVAEEVKQLKK